MMTDEERQAWALYRYRCISGLVDPLASAAERQAWHRWLQHYPPANPRGIARTPSRRTVGRWIRRSQQGGLDALAPQRRRDCGHRRTIPPEVWDQAVALKQAVPQRSADQVLALLAAWAPEAGIDPAVIAGIRRATLYRHWQRAGITRHRRPVTTPPRRFRRWEASAPGELWQSDVMDGPSVPDPTPADPRRTRKTYCLVILADDSRRIVAGRWAWSADAALLEAVLWDAWPRWGAPHRFYCDNGALDVTERLEQILARLPMRLIHSRPYRPQGQGKQERWWGHLETSFVAELAVQPASSLGELNQWFDAWCEEHDHRRVHRMTGETPLARWGTGGVHRILSGDPWRLAFQQQVTRRVDQCGQVQWQGRTGLVPEGLVQVTVPRRYDPHRPDCPPVWYAGQLYGLAQPVDGGTTSPPPPTAERPSPDPPGLSYLVLLARQHAARHPGLRLAPPCEEEDTP